MLYVVCVLVVSCLLATCEAYSDQDGPINGWDQNKPPQGGSRSQQSFYGGYYDRRVQYGGYVYRYGANRCPETTEYRQILGGGYACVCKKGYYYPTRSHTDLFYDYKREQCLPCNRKCQECVDENLCIVQRRDKFSKQRSGWFRFG